MNKSPQNTPSWITVNLIVGSLMACAGVTFWLWNRFGDIEGWAYSRPSPWGIAAYGFLPAVVLVALMVGGRFPMGWLRAGSWLQRTCGSLALLSAGWLAYVMLKWSAVFDWEERLSQQTVLLSLAAVTMLIPAIALALRGVRTRGTREVSRPQPSFESGA